MNGVGAKDLMAAASSLADRVPLALAPIASLAYNYRWSWFRDGHEVFESVDPYRWAVCRENPVRLLQETSGFALERAAGDPRVVEAAQALEQRVQEDLARPASMASTDRPVVFVCAEYGVHRSLPTYSGGLGVLAGDILKEASDLALPMVAVGILYRQGNFHQRVDQTGWQHEYWLEADPDRLPAALVTGDDGAPLTVSVPMRGREVTLQVWRVDVGRTPLFLLDAQRPENSRTDRWITARLYVGDRTLRLAQYAVLGIGAIRAMRAFGIEPSVVHLNEGHAGLAPVELARRAVESARPFEEAFEEARGRTIFTTHTPVPAGNEQYSAEEISSVLGDYPATLGIDEQRFLGLARINPEDRSEWFGLTPLGLRASRTANAVSARHGHVARAMWRPLYGNAPAEEVPIDHVTNGVHLSTWMAPAMQALLDRHLGPGWLERHDEEDAWARVDDIPDEDLWDVRCRLRADLVEYVRDRSVGDRLARDDSPHDAESAARAFDPDLLTLGFARRVAGYKRLYLLVRDPSRMTRLLETGPPFQLVIAGKAHPQDEVAKGVLQTIFRMKWEPHVAERVAYLEDYDMGMAARLVRGCDVWINLPRAPLEASGTSGMKSALNGGLNLSVLDGWWEEAFDGNNGWGIRGDPSLSADEQDDRDAAALFEVLEREVLPLFHERDVSGVPRGWLRKVKASLRTIGPRFNARRMVHDYAAARYLLD